MGAAISSTVVDNMRNMQKEMQTEMMVQQRISMAQSQERMRRVMVAQQMAVAREMVNWYGAGYGCLILGMVGAKVKTGRVPPVMAAPLVVGGLVLGYQIDFAYGTKPERIEASFRHILQEDHWFSHLPPPEVPIPAKDVPQ